MSKDTIKFQVARKDENGTGYVPPMVADAENVLDEIYEYLDIEAEGDWIGHIENHPTISRSYKARMVDDRGEAFYVFVFEKHQPALTLKF